MGFVTSAECIPNRIGHATHTN